MQANLFPCCMISASFFSRPQSGGFERSALAFGHAVNGEFFYRFAKEPMKIELRSEMQKHPAETDRRAVHEHEFARHPDGPLFPQRAMNPESLASAVFGRLYAVRDGALAVIEQRPIDEPGPDAEDVDEFARQAAEPPGFIGMHHQGLVAMEKAVVQVDHTADEFRRKDADAAVVQQVDSLRRTILDECRVVAEMRVAMDHPEPAERVPPRLEHRDRNAVAHRDVVPLMGQQLAPFEPVEGEEALC